MTKFKFSKRSLNVLVGVHPDLQKVARRAIELTEVDFIITEGRRTVERQKELVAKGASKTMNSRHLTGHAIDVVAWDGTKVSYSAVFMLQIATSFKAAASELKIPIVWGGDWGRTEKKLGWDSPHFELDRRKYPARES